MAGAADRHEQAATFKEFELIGAYRTFDDPDRSASAIGPVPATASTAGQTGGAQTDALSRAISTAARPPANKSNMTIGVLH